MEKLEKLYHELAHLDGKYELHFKEIENSVSFILDEPKMIPVCIRRQFCMKTEIYIIPNNDGVNVIGNTIYLDFETPNENNHYSNILEEGDYCPKSIHHAIQTYLIKVSQRYRPEARLAAIAGNTPKPLHWITEFVTCHIDNNNLRLSTGLIRVDDDLSKLLGLNLQYVQSNDLAYAIKANSTLMHGNY